MTRYIVEIERKDNHERHWHDDSKAALKDYKLTCKVIGKGTIVRLCIVTIESEWRKP